MKIDKEWSPYSIELIRFIERRCQNCTVLFLQRVQLGVKRVFDSNTIDNPSDEAPCEEVGLFVEGKQFNLRKASGSSYINCCNPRFPQQ